MPKTREDWFFAVCWLVAAYFAVGIVWTVGFPPSAVRDQWPMLAAFGFFFILPFVSKIDLFQLVSVERKLEAVKEKVDDAKEKVKEVNDRITQVLIAQQTLTSTVQSLNNNNQAVNVYTAEPPSQKEIEKAEASVSEIEPGASEKLLMTSEELEDLVNAIKIGLGDHKVATNRYTQGSFLLQNPPFAKVDTRDRVILMRTQIEREMKRLLLEAGETFNRPPNWRMLASRVSQHYPAFDEAKAVDVFFRIALPLVHGEDLPDKDVDHAAYIGERLLTVLRGIG